MRHIITKQAMRISDAQTSVFIFEVVRLTAVDIVIHEILLVEMGRFVGVVTLVDIQESFIQSSLRWLLLDLIVG